MTVDAGVRSIQGHDKRWNLSELPAGGVERLAASLGCASLTARVLLARGHDVHSARDFLEDDAAGTGIALDGMDRAVERIELAVRRGESVFIHGDYDVDGITAAYVLRTAIEKLGGHPEVFLPHRLRC